jgi:hypothetical protein
MPAPEAGVFFWIYPVLNTIVIALITLSNRTVLLFCPWGHSPSYVLNRRLCGLLNRFWRFSEERNPWFQTFAAFWMSYVFFRDVLRRMEFSCQRFGTLCSIFIGEWVRRQTGCSETLATKLHTGHGPQFPIIFYCYTKFLLLCMFNFVIVMCVLCIVCM